MKNTGNRSPPFWSCCVNILQKFTLSKNVRLHHRKFMQNGRGTLEASYFGYLLLLAHQQHAVRHVPTRLARHPERDDQMMGKTGVPAHVATCRAPPLWSSWFQPLLVSNSHTHIHTPYMYMYMYKRPYHIVVCPYNPNSSCAAAAPAGWTCFAGPLVVQLSVRETVSCISTRLVHRLSPTYCTYFIYFFSTPNRKAPQAKRISYSSFVRSVHYMPSNKYITLLSRRIYP